MAPDIDPKDITIRLATDADHDVIRELFRSGEMEGHLRDNDTGADIDSLLEAYFSDEGASAFWVACHGKGVVQPATPVQTLSQDRIGSGWDTVDHVLLGPS